MKEFICKIADFEELERKWDYEIENHPNDNSWIVWKNIHLKMKHQNQRR